MAPLVTIHAYGKPVSRGSKTPFVLYKDRARKIPVRRADGSIVVNMTDSAGPESKAWMETVAAAARAAWIGAPLAEVGIVVDCTFFMPRPEGHYGTGRNAGRLKDSAPARPIVMPDIDKLARGTLDALTGIVWKDDSQLVRVVYDEWYAVRKSADDDGCGVQIVVERAAEQTAADLPENLRERWTPDAAPVQEVLAL